MEEVILILASAWAWVVPLRSERPAILRVHGGHNIERFEEFTCINVKVDFCQGN